MLDRLKVATETPKEAAERLKTTCYLCEARFSPDSDAPTRRNHIGGHILKAMRSVTEDLLLVNEVSNPHIPVTFRLTKPVGWSIPMWYLREIDRRLLPHTDNQSRQY